MRPAIIELTVAFLILAAYASWISIHVRSTYRFKWLAAPLILGVALLMIMKLPDLEGYPYPGYPKGEFQYLAHKVEGQGQEKTIQLWAKVGKDETRLFQIPFDTATEAKLENAQDALQHGRSTKGRFKDGKSGMNGNEQSLAESSLTTVTQPQVTLPPKG